MLGTQIQTIRTIICSLSKDLNISYRVPLFDDKLYQECIDEAVRRGYPVGDDQPLRRYLQDGVKFSAISYEHITYRPTQIWMALYFATTVYVDDVPSRFPAELHNISLFNDQFLKREEHGNAILDVLADVIRQAPDLFPRVVSDLITTSTLDFITATLLECETASMEIPDAARQYPTYLRNLSGVPMPYAFTVFPREIPLNEYIQAMPEVMQIINELNDVLSFYKEELVGDNTNQISIIAARDKEAKLEVFKRMAESVTDLYKSVEKILARSPAACDAFKHFVVGYSNSHFSVERYKLVDLDLNL